MKRFLEPSELLETLNQRYATKIFDPSKPIAEEDERALLESLRLSPSSFGLQPWKWIVVRDPALRKNLREVSWNQSQVEDAPLYVVFAVRDSVDEAHVRKHIERTAELRHVFPESLAGYESVLMEKIVQAKTPEERRRWAVPQLYIAMGFLGLSASLLGVDTCMLGGIEPEKYDEMLGLEGTGYSTVAAVAVGYRSDADKYGTLAKSRFAEEDVVEYR